VRGRAGHAAFAGADKASAIHELAHQIIALEGLNDPGRGIVVNVGVVGGGIGPNTVSDSAFAEIDARFLHLADALAVEEQVTAIASRPTIAGTSAALTNTGGRPPMEQSEGNTALYHLLREEAEGIGLSCAAELRSGVSDANTLAREGLAVVDGLGPIGAGDHSEKEYMVRSSLAERTLLAALAIARLSGSRALS
jgi:glutamate carboxypeptidase